MLMKKLAPVCILLLLLFPGTRAFAVQVKLSLQFPLGGASVVDGFDNSTLRTSGISFKALSPVAPDTMLGLGLSIFNARVQDSPSVSTRYEGIVNAYMFEVGADYSGIELFDDYSLVFDVSVEFPLSGEGRVESTGGSEVSKATSVSGVGYYLGAGVRKGRWEMGAFYKRNDVSYGEMSVTRDGKSEDVAFHFSAYGLSLGYLF